MSDTTSANNGWVESYLDALVSANALCIYHPIDLAASEMQLPGCKLPATCICNMHICVRRCWAEQAAA